LGQERRPRKTYTREFKLNAIRLTSTGGVSVAQAARDLGLCENTLHKWRQEAKRDPEHAFPGKGHLKPLEEENRRLRRENKALADEVKFLKRAAVWLAREAPRSTV
jgi:transposase